MTNHQEHKGHEVSADFRKVLVVKHFFVSFVSFVVNGLHNTADKGRVNNAIH
jgi:hypothetical protein